MDTMSAPTNELGRILAEQRECRDYIVENKGPDTEGAWRGMGDWLKEEILMGQEQEQ